MAVAQKKAPERPEEKTVDASVASFVSHSRSSGLCKFAVGFL